MAAEKKRIGLREVRALGQHEEVWDAAVTGFGARRQNSDAVAYVLLYRTLHGVSRRMTIGRHGAPWLPDTARSEALRLLGIVAQGGDPASDKQERRKAVTVAELCADYMKAARGGTLLTRKGAAKKSSTLDVDAGRIERHILPLLGKLPVAAVTRRDVTRLMHDVAGGKTAATVKTKARGLARVTGGRTAATRAVGLLGSIFGYAVERGLVEANPAHGVRRFTDNRKERRLSNDEYAALGKALAKAEGDGMWLPAVGALRLLALTGWRTAEAAALRRGEADLAARTARLADSKTGKSIRPLSHAACDVLRAMPRIGRDHATFPASRGEGTVALKQYWRRVAKLAGFGPDVTLHTLRHSFASLAGDLGYSETTIAALVGHTGRSVTSRYVHAADAVLLAAADAVAGRTAELMGNAAAPGVVVPLRAAV